MKVNYSEGTWFAVPLCSGGFGVGIAARTTKKGPVIGMIVRTKQYREVTRAA